MIDSYKKTTTHFPMAFFGTFSEHVQSNLQRVQNDSKMLRNFSDHIAKFGRLQNFSNRFGTFLDINIFELQMHNAHLWDTFSGGLSHSRAQFACSLKARVDHTQERSLVPTSWIRSFTIWIIMPPNNEETIREPPALKNGVKPKAIGGAGGLLVPPAARRGMNLPIIL